LDNYSQKKCGFCGENIPAEADRCPYCGSILEVTVDSPYKMPEQQGDAPGAGVSETGDSVQGNGPVQDQQDAANQNDTYAPQYGQTPPQYEQTPPQYGQTPPQGMGQGPAYGQRYDYGQRPYYPRQQQSPAYRSSTRPPLSNGLKVFLTMLFTLLPGIGQIAGIITAIVFMSSDGDEDRRSFGVALLVASLVMFVLSCLGCFLLYSIGENLSF
jgi:hypothetical protein